MSILRQFAQSLTAGTGADQVNVPAISADQVLKNGLDLVYFAAGIIAVITIIIGAIMYASSAGDAGTVTKAKNLIVFAVVGIVVILSAFAVTNFLIGSAK